MSKKLKIVFLDRGTAGPIELTKRFSKYGKYIEYWDTEKNELEARIREADVVILNRIKLGEKEFEKSPLLRLVLITATGFNHIDIDAANSRGITVANVSGYSTSSVAQLTMTLMLNELTKVSRYSDDVKKNRWNMITYSDAQKYPIDDAEGKILGIVGYGNIGKRVEEMAKIFGMNTMIAEIPGREYTGIGDRRRFKLDEILEKCDILSIHAPLTELTRNLITLDKMKKMKKSAIILNLGRGPIINEDDLYTALKYNVIRSAAIDVMSKEPPEEDSKLLELDNLTITPHIAWKSQKSMERLFEVIENNMKLFIEGKLTGLK